MQLTMELELVKDQVIIVIEETAELFKKYFVSSRVSHKMGIQQTTSIVTDADIAIEKHLKDRLLHLYPDTGFIGEEGGHAIGKEYTWVIDPVDGTLNFSRQIPICGTTVTLLKEASPILHVMDFPLLNERVVAVKGGGVTFNGTGVVKANGSLRNDPILLYAQVSSPEDKIKVITALLKQGLPYPMRVQCASYMFALLATYRADGGLFLNQAPWDVSGAELIAAELDLELAWLRPKSPTLADFKARGYSMSLIFGNKYYSGKLKKLISDKEI